MLSGKNIANEHIEKLRAAIRDYEESAQRVSRAEKDREKLRSEFIERRKGNEPDNGLRRRKDD